MHHLLQTNEFTMLTDDQRTAMKWKFLLERCKIYVKVLYCGFQCSAAVRVSYKITCLKILMICCRSSRPLKWGLGSEGWSWPAHGLTQERWSSTCRPCCSGCDHSSHWLSRRALVVLGCFHCCVVPFGLRCWQWQQPFTHCGFVFWG